MEIRLYRGRFWRSGGRLPAGVQAGEEERGTVLEGRSRVTWSPLARAIYPR
jgi:hypothetical protein